MKPIDNYRLVTSDDLTRCPSNLMRRPNAEYLECARSEMRGARRWRLSPRSASPFPLRLLAVASLLLASGSIAHAVPAATPPLSGLLFSLSADHGTTADFSAAGTPQPTFDAEVSVVPDGAAGPALRCGNFQRLAWRAPGNIYAQRGTLAFFWRARDAVGPTAFPIFRVGYADHSSWDMVWLRIDYNGHGFDAFVTDTGLARTRVSVPLTPFPTPDKWIHLALSWDETRGIRFYIDGRLAAKNETTAVYDAGLDQFGPHSRIISPYQVQSDYNFIRGGDIDEIRIYDHALPDDRVESLSIAGQGLPPPPALAAPPHHTIPTPTALSTLLAAFLHRYGFDDPAHLPPELPAAKTAVRKVEIHDAYDQKRWWWKATDGIRETTWPGVYNRSRLPGRHDYFELPDWDCYSTSGKSVTFTLPDEPWNQLEFTGAAWGRMTLGADASAPLLFDRARGAEHTVNFFPAPHTGGKITFANVEQEQPIGELVALHVAPGEEPIGRAQQKFWLDVGDFSAASPHPLDALETFIVGRHPAGERYRATASSAPPPHLANGSGVHLDQLPLVHVTIPDTWDDRADALDGLAIDLPDFKNLPPTHGGLIAFNLRVKDPLWPARDLLDFSFSVKPGEPHTLWLDLRDRVLPTGKPLYLTLASSAPAFTELSLRGAAVRLVFKPRDAALAEHTLDRFTQARDAYAMLVEEHPKSPKYALWVRFESDLKDLLRVDPDHELGRRYAAAAGIPAAKPPAPALATPPPGVPLWAQRQTELLGRVRKFVLWYIDHRQIADGEFGGGISDDTDLTNTWPGVALMGAEPEKLRRSLNALLDAAYANGMFTHGLPTIQADELHSYEEGINCLSQNLILDYASPRQLERAMETIRGLETLTGVNAAGHRHIRSSYFSGAKLAEDGPWGWSKPFSYLILHPAYLLTDYNGNPAARKLVVELADGLLAHRKPGAGTDSLPGAIHFATDAETEAARNFFPWPLFWAAWRWTGDRKYLDSIADGGLTYYSALNANALDLLSLRDEWSRRLAAGDRPGAFESRHADGRAHSLDSTFRTSTPTHFAWQLSGDKSILEKLYADQIAQCDLLEYINTEGSLWIDRVAVPYADLQRARLGGVALARNALYPGHVVSWRFAAPADDQSVAVLVPDATSTAFKVIACNVTAAPVHATMTGWDIAPGQWEITQGVDTNNDDLADSAQLPSHATPFERSASLQFTLPARATTVLTFKLKTPGTPYWQRPDLGLDPSDIARTATGLTIKIHSLGSTPTGATPLVIRNAAGAIVARATIPPLAAPNDLLPKTVDVAFPLPADFSAAGATIEIDPDHTVEEITRLNNAARL